MTRNNIYDYMFYKYIAVRFLHQVSLFLMMPFIVLINVDSRKKIYFLNRGIFLDGLH